MVSDIGEKLLEAAAEARLATRPQSARAVVKSVMPYLARLRVGGYSWGEIAAAAGKAALVKPDGSAFTAKVLAEYFGSLGGAALVTGAGWFAASRLIAAPPLEALRTDG